MGKHSNAPKGVGKIFSGGIILLIGQMLLYLAKSMSTGSGEMDASAAFLTVGALAGVAGCIQVITGLNAMTEDRDTFEKAVHSMFIVLAAGLLNAGAGSSSVAGLVLTLVFWGSCFAATSFTIQGLCELPMCASVVDVGKVTIKVLLVAALLGMAFAVAQFLVDLNSLVSFLGLLITMVFFGLFLFFIATARREM